MIWNKRIAMDYVPVLSAWIEIQHRSNPVKMQRLIFEVAKQEISGLKGEGRFIKKLGTLISV